MARTVYSIGEALGFKKPGSDLCPYKDGTRRKAWLEGFAAAQRDLFRNWSGID